MTVSSPSSLSNQRTMLFWGMLSVVFLSLIAPGRAFLTGTQPSITTTNHVNLRRQKNHRQSSICLFMAVGKTGGLVLPTEEAFTKQVLQKSEKKLILAFFTAPWCGPCRITVPVVKEIMKEFPSSQLQVVEICTDDLPQVAADANVVNIPTIQLYSDGEVKDTIVGCVAKGVLAGSIEKVLEDLGQKVE